MRIAIVLGTRPEIIKMAPVIRACQRRGAEFFILHTGQHYSYEMDRVFFEQLQLPDPLHNLDVGSETHGQQTAKMLAGIEAVLVKEKPTHVLVQGDTNSVMAGALAAAKLRIKIGHVEAGLRSNDRTMPEEINRIVTDHVSDYLFAPTAECAALLRQEGIPEEKIHITGNTIVDAVFQNRDLAEERSAVLKTLGLGRREFILMTAHRQENVDDPKRFQGIMTGASAVSHELGLPVVYPIHPRSRKMLAEHRIETNGIRLVPPVDFLDFLSLENHARLVLTDSGGVQEEACILGVPCVTLRDNTERPETVTVGGNVLAGASAAAIQEKSRLQLRRPRNWRQPYGDGTAGDQIVHILQG